MKFVMSPICWSIACFIVRYGGTVWPSFLFACPVFGGVVLRRILELYGVQQLQRSNKWMRMCVEWPVCSCWFVCRAVQLGTQNWSANHMHRPCKIHSHACAVATAAVLVALEFSFNGIWPLGFPQQPFIPAGFLRAAYASLTPKA